MAKLYNLARMTTSTTGAGTATLGSAVAGFLSFANAGVSNGETITYAIDDGANSEIGRGVYSSAGPTLTRVVLRSTNSNNAINLSGSAQVIITPAAEDFDELSVYGVCFARLTLTSGTAVTASDVTAATNLYITPYLGNRVALYTGTMWVVRTFSEITVSLSGFAADTNFDVFVYDNAGTVTAETVAWTNATTRATAITLQDGVYVKSGATTRRYLGTIRTTGTTGQSEDSAAKRFVWNLHHPVARHMRVLDTTNSWTYSTNSFRQSNGSTANQLAFVLGLDRSVTAHAMSVAANATGGFQYVSSAIGLDSTSAPASGSMYSVIAVTSQVVTSAVAIYDGSPGVGYHYLAWLERGSTSDTQTWYGDHGGSASNNHQNGIGGSLMG